MLKQDKIKLIVASILISVIIITYYFFEKESMVMKSVAGFSFACWIITMVYLNKKFK